MEKVRITDTSDLWWKSAVIYCVDVKTFMDWNDDGVGDFVLEGGWVERKDDGAAAVSVGAGGINFGGKAGAEVG